MSNAIYGGIFLVGVSVAIGAVIFASGAAQTFAAGALTGVAASLGFGLLGNDQ